MRVTDIGAKAALPRPEIALRAAIRAEIGPAVEFETTHGWTRSVFPITGGVMRGDGLDGVIIPGGADFAQLLPDGSYAIEARYCVRLADGVTVMITNAGRMFPHASGGFQGRTRAAFEAPAGPYAWLSEAVFFGTALSERGDEHNVFIELWEALL